MDKEIGRKGHNTKDQEMLEKKAFGEHPLAWFVFKKLEKLSAACYLVTSSMPVADPLQSSIRIESISLLHAAMDTARDAVLLTQMQRRIAGMTALLRVAYVAGYVSEMNFSILSREYISLGALLAEREHEWKGGAVLTISPESLGVSMEAAPRQAPLPAWTAAFGKPELPQASSYKPVATDSSTLIKDNQKGAYKRHVRAVQNIPNKNERRERILTLLVDKPAITVKDAVRAIPSCSEKTLQRELIALVQEGTLKREGERRWSTYSKR